MYDALQPLLAFAGKATVVLAFALVAVRLLRHGSAASRHAVWAGALAIVAGLPIGARLLPAWSLEILPAATPVAAVTSHAARALPSTSGAGDLSGLLLLLWAVGAAVVLLRTAVGWVGVARLRRRAVALDSQIFAREARRIADRLGIRRPVTLLAAAERVGPLTWGTLRPAILLPADALEWDEDRRRIVLTHELGHVVRFDVLTQAVTHLALAVAWFHPLAWLAVRREREERERACDDLVLRAGTRASRYAGELVAIARTASGFGPSRAVAAMARRSELEARLVALLDPRVERGGVTRRSAVLLGAGLLAVLPLAMAMPVARPPVEVAELGPAEAVGGSASGAPPAPHAVPGAPAQASSDRASRSRRGESSAGPRRLAPLSPMPAGLATAAGGRSLGALSGRPAPMRGSLGALSGPLSPMRGSLSPPLHPSS